jgi:hypothetical protein
MVKNNGNILVGATVSFERSNVVGQDGKTVTPRKVAAISDANGEFIIKLYSGNYKGTVSVPQKQDEYFSMGIPEGDLSGTLHQYINQAQVFIPAKEVVDAQAARDAAQAAANDPNVIAVGGDLLGVNNIGGAVAAAAQVAADKIIIDADMQAAAASAAQAALEAGYGPIIINDTIMSANLSIPIGSNGYSVGPIEIAAGVTVAVADGSVYAVI